jgi:hypothetical protein
MNKTREDGGLPTTARVAPYLDAIRAKRAAGWPWAAIKAAMGLDCPDHTLGSAVRNCRWKTEQLPFPDYKSGNKKQEAKESGAPTASQKRELPRVERSGEGDNLTAAQRVLARIPKIGE